MSKYLYPNRASAESAYRDESAKVMAAEWMLFHKPEWTGSTGKIKGSDSRYTMRAWVRSSGYVNYAITHECDGQHPSTTIGTDLRKDGAARAAIYVPGHDTELCAVRELWHDALAFASGAF